MVSVNKCKIVTNLIFLNFYTQHLTDCYTCYSLNGKKNVLVLPFVIFCNWYENFAFPLLK